MESVHIEGLRSVSLLACLRTCVVAGCHSNCKPRFADDTQIARITSNYNSNVIPLNVVKFITTDTKQNMRHKRGIFANDVQSPDGGLWRNT